MLCGVDVVRLPESRSTCRAGFATSAGLAADGGIATSARTDPSCESRRWPATAGGRSGRGRRLLPSPDHESGSVRLVRADAAARPAGLGRHVGGDRHPASVPVVRSVADGVHGSARCLVFPRGRHRGRPGWRLALDPGPVMLQHVTIQTGHIRTSPRSEVAAEAVALLRVRFLPSLAVPVGQRCGRAVDVWRDLAGHQWPGEPARPWVADRIDPGILALDDGPAADVAVWSADMARCLAWAVLPDDVAAITGASGPDPH